MLKPLKELLSPLTISEADEPHRYVHLLLRMYELTLINQCIVLLGAVFFFFAC